MCTLYAHSIYLIFKTDSKFLNYTIIYDQRGSTNIICTYILYLYKKKKREK